MFVIPQLHPAWLKHLTRFEFPDNNRAFKRWLHSCFIRSATVALSVSHSRGKFSAERSQDVLSHISAGFGETPWRASLCNILFIAGIAGAAPCEIRECLKDYKYGKNSESRQAFEAASGYGWSFKCYWKGLKLKQQLLLNWRIKE